MDFHKRKSIKIHNFWEINLKKLYLIDFLRFLSESQL
jgi:hypothetical protein